MITLTLPAEQPALVSAPPPRRPRKPDGPVCASETCNNRRRRKHLMCRHCWAAVPADIRSAVYAAYKPAAGIRQSPEWAAAAQRAIDSRRPTEA